MTPCHCNEKPLCRAEVMAALAAFAETYKLTLFALLLFTLVVVLTGAA